jgi:hypothetical protein
MFDFLWLIASTRLHLRLLFRKGRRACLISSFLFALSDKLHRGNPVVTFGLFGVRGQLRKAVSTRNVVSSSGEPPFKMDYSNSFGIINLEFRHDLTTAGTYFWPFMPFNLLLLSRKNYRA